MMRTLSTTWPAFTRRSRTCATRSWRSVPPAGPRRRGPTSSRRSPGRSTAPAYHSDAALAWSQYLKARPDADFARRERGFAWARAGDKNQALPDLAWYVQKHPEDYLGHFQYAVALTVSDKAKAASELNRAIALKPDFVLGLHTRGALLLQEGKPEDALADLERVVKLEPDNARALDYLGQVYRELNRPADAERVLRRAVELNPNDGPTLMHLGHASARRRQGR